MRREGPDSRRYPWGSAEPGPTLLNACGTECVANARSAWGFAWEALYAGDDGFATTAPVGSFPAGDSPFKLHDMSGNVWEWTSSRWTSDYSHAEAGSARVNRGGGWGRNAHTLAFLQGSGRDRNGQSDRHSILGFRCAR